MEATDVLIEMLIEMIFSLEAVHAYPSAVLEGALVHFIWCRRDMGLHMTLYIEFSGCSEVAADMKANVWLIVIIPGLIDGCRGSSFPFIWYRVRVDHRRGCDAREVVIFSLTRRPLSRT